jgi:hypothetical protein
MNIFFRSIKAVATWITSDKGKAALKQAAELAPKALPVIQQIDKLAGDRNVHEVAEAFEHYGVPFAAEFVSMGPGAALLHLATQVLAAELPGVGTSILQTAIQLAVAGSR